MPLWLIYHPYGTLTDPETRQNLVKAITKIYTDGPVRLPAFYVVVNFLPLPPTDVYIGGEQLTTRKPFIRFVVDHIAAKAPETDAGYAGLTAQLDEALKPFVEGKGFDWEYHVRETERRLWKINGIAPPALRTEGHERWRVENRPVPL